MLQFDDAVELMKRAIAAGATRTGPFSAVWKAHADCENPFIRVVQGRPSDPNSRYWEWVPGRRATITIEQWMRCNHCSRCLRARARLWADRMKYEVENAPRTWFGTLTLNPARHFHCEVVARKERRDYDELDDITQRKERLAVSGSEVTRYLKRLRKAATGKLRFVCVTEMHKSGLPHYHMFIHEQVRDCIKHRQLADQWTWGFEKWRLIEPQSKPVWYLCKYLAKENCDRVRASILYGGRTKDGTR